MNDKNDSKKSTLRLSLNRETLKHLNTRSGLRTGVAGPGATVGCAAPPPVSGDGGNPIVPTVVGCGGGGLNNGRTYTCINAG
jgi:hypothetical protein